MDWQALIATVAVSTTTIGAVTWLAKSLVSQWLTRDIERFKASLATESTRSVEELRARLHLEAQRHQIVFSSLHTRRGEVIAELYTKLEGVDRAVAQVMTQHGYREIRQDTDRRMATPREPYVVRPGYEILSDSEKEDVHNLGQVTIDFYRFYARHRIYFSPGACDLLERFGTLSFFLAGNYHNVAFKDKDGNLYVAAEVKQMWDTAIGTMPQLKRLLESEFRALLGVTLPEPSPPPSP